MTKKVPSLLSRSLLLQVCIVFLFSAFLMTAICKISASFNLLFLHSLTMWTWIYLVFLKYRNKINVYSDIVFLLHLHYWLNKYFIVCQPQIFIEVIFHRTSALHKVSYCVTVMWFHQGEYSNPFLILDRSKSTSRPESRDNSIPREPEPTRQYSPVDVEAFGKMAIAIIDEYTHNSDPEVLSFKSTIQVVIVRDSFNYWQKNGKIHFCE